MLKRALLACMALLVSACATAPATRTDASSNRAASGKLGVLNLLPQDYAHYHYGTTIFNNFIHHAAPPAPIAEEVQAKLVETLKAKGYDVVVLTAPEELLKAALKDQLTSVGWSAFSLKKEWRATFDKARVGVDRVVVITEGTGTPYYQWPSARGIGVYTRSLMGLDNAFAMLAVSYSLVESGQYDLRGLAQREAFGEEVAFRGYKPFDWPSNIDETAPFEAERVVPLLRELMAAQATYVVDHLETR